jgi:large subunit ribosomal protein L6
MSRIGLKEIQIPDGVSVTIDNNNVAVKGKLGQLQHELHPNISIEQQDNILHVKRASDKKFDKSLHGLSRSLVSNMIEGVSQGFSKELELQGVGYRFELKDKSVVFFVGYSTPKEFNLPDGIAAEETGKNVLKVSGIDKQAVGQVAANIRAIRPPDAYKGKGIRYRGERIKLKPGKSGV